MQMDLETLIKLLQNFHEELTICIEYEDSKGTPFKSKDPILLGDFIMDAYNSYLGAAKTACENPIIQAMPEVEKLDYVANDDSGSVGKNPRFQKMHEIAFMARQLQTVLEGEVKTREAKTQSEIVGVMALLDNLGEQIEHAQEIIRENPEEGEQSVRHLAEEYNRYLGIAMEATEDDVVLAKMFSPLEPVVDETTSYQDKFSELRLAQSGLLSYLQKMDKRSEHGAVDERHERRRKRRR